MNKKKIIFLVVVLLLIVGGLWIYIQYEKAVLSSTLMYPSADFGQYKPQNKTLVNDDEILDMPWGKTFLENIAYLQRFNYEFNTARWSKTAYNIYDQVAKGKIKADSVVDILKIVLKNFPKGKDKVKFWVLPAALENPQQYKKLIWLGEKFNDWSGKVYYGELVTKQQDVPYTGKQWIFDENSQSFTGVEKEIALSTTWHTTDLMEEIAQNYLFETRLGYIPREYVGKDARSDSTSENRYGTELKQRMGKVREYYEKLKKKKGLVITGFEFERQLVANNKYAQNNVYIFSMPVVAEYKYKVKGYKKFLFFKIPFEARVCQNFVFDVDMHEPVYSQKKPDNYVTLVYVSKPYTYTSYNPNDYNDDTKAKSLPHKAPFDPNIIPDELVDSMMKYNIDEAGYIIVK